MVVMAINGYGIETVEMLPDQLLTPRGGLGLLSRLSLRITWRMADCSTGIAKGSTCIRAMK
jgi:hypothetical protein